MGKIITSTIYCLKNPLDYNRIFYVGRTTQPLSRRLAGHCSKPHSPVLEKLITEIKAAGKRPIIKAIEVCNGYGYAREKYWIRYHHRKGRRLLQGTYSRPPSKKPVNHYYW